MESCAVTARAEPLSALRTEQVASEEDHRVLVYGDALELVRALGEFSSDALSRGGAVVLVANSEHIEAAGEWVRLMSEHIGSAVEDRYITLDVDAVIAGFARSANPASAFEALVDDVCGRIPAGVGAVHVYDDLAGTLWARGRVSVALEIEALGARMSKERGVSVFCAYPKDLLSRVSDLQTIGRCHTAVVPPPFVPAGTLDAGDALADTSRSADDGRHVANERTGPRRHFHPLVRTKVFPAAVSSCRAARHFLRSTLIDAGEGAQLADAAELVCSELAANAVRHAHSVFTVQVARTPGGVSLAVGDEAQASETTMDFPVRLARGLGIVTSLAVDWGIEASQSGKVVWAHLEAR